MFIRRIVFIAAAVLTAVSCSSSPKWEPVGENIKTRWAAEVSPANAHPEYPRPQMRRSDWKCLNGLWDYAICAKDIEGMPGVDGQILVPFAVESSLSGVGRSVTPEQALWYRTSFRIPRAWKGKKVILHFDGVDWMAEPMINGQKLETHTGCYTSFEYDITPYIKGGEQTLVMKVTDATDAFDSQPRGKQVLKPRGIWYTAVTGIWKSVWIEPVDESRIVDYNVVSDIDAATLAVTVDACISDGDAVKVELLEGAVGYCTCKPSDKVIACVEAVPGTPAVLNVPDMKTWSPASPYLYGLKISVVRDGKAVDTVQGYTAMRKVSIVKDANGHKVMAINNEPIFHYGPLDQGWWPDGLYTPPTDEAMKYDLKVTLDHGFNMIRKHIKVESYTWFYACDQMGILVWQDMPSFADNHKQKWAGYEGTDYPVTDEQCATYYKEWGEIMAQLKKFPCIVMWVPFNEAWGQFRTADAVDFTRATDPTRLVNMASGGNFEHGVGDIIDIHTYPAPRRTKHFDPELVNVVGEYGGIGLPIEGHLWEIGRKWGYVQYKTGEEVTDAYVKYAGIMKDMVADGYCGAVYTQTTDVEGVVNGLMTYDREIIKMDVARVKEANTAVIEALK